MKREKTTQANYRLPASLLSDLKFVSDEIAEPQTAIVKAAVETRIKVLKRKIERRNEKKLEAATV